jgi:hypothetical protein
LALSGSGKIDGPPLCTLICMLVIGSYMLLKAVL